MSGSNFENIFEIAAADAATDEDFTDRSIPCIDCAQDFVWTAGEQAFFRQKDLLNPPKRCKDCKRAKNRRLEAIEVANVTGKPHRIEVKAECARCGQSTTVPFYPSQGRPVYCRDCFAAMKNESANRANA